MTVKNVIFLKCIRRVALVRTDISEERIASIMMTRISEVRTSSVTSNRSSLRRNVPPKRPFQPRATRKHPRRRQSSIRSVQFIWALQSHASGQAVVSPRSTRGMSGFVLSFPLEGLTIGQSASHPDTLVSRRAGLDVARDVYWESCLRKPLIQSEAGTPSVEFKRSMSESDH
jgi:hypothetical protein